MRGESIERELQELERAMVALRVEYERFLVGDQKLAPLQSRRKVETWLRKLGNQEIDRTAERFKLQSIQSRFNAMAEVWEKRQQARDEGRISLGVAPRSGALRPPTSGAEAAAGAAASGERQAAQDPNAAASASVEAKRRVDFSPLFDRYCTARQALGEDISKLRYERFEELVKKQAEEIRRRTGARRLVFEVQTVEGKVRLVGRPAPTKG